MKKLMFFAAAMMLSLANVSCSDSDDNGDNGGGTTTKEYVKTTATLNYTYTGAIFELIDITSVEVFVDEVKVANPAITESTGSIKIDLGVLKPLSKANVYINTERNDTAVDETKTYNHKTNFEFTVTRHFSDNTTDSVVKKMTGHSISGIDVEKIEEYLELYRNDSSSIEINSQGALAN